MLRFISVFTAIVFAAIVFAAIVFAAIVFAATLLAAAPHFDSGADRAAFRRWFTFLAESRYYARKPLAEVADGWSLIRWASRMALARHDAAWSRTLELPVFPVMPSVSVMPSEPLTPVFVSRDLAAAQPGDLLLFRNTGLSASVMVYIGKSQVVPSPQRWVIYLTAGSTHKVSLDKLMADPSPDWRPVAENPEFSGVWRLSSESVATSPERTYSSPQSGEVR